MDVCCFEELEAVCQFLAFYLLCSFETELGQKDYEIKSTKYDYYKLKLQLPLKTKNNIEITPMMTRVPMWCLRGH